MCIRDSINAEYGGINTNVMKLRLLTLFLVLGTSLTSFASTADLFAFNEDAIEVEFSEISAFETFVLENNGMTYTDMQAAGALSQFSLDFNTFDASAAPMFGFEDVDWTSFLWGFCCFPCGAIIGVFTVLLNDNKDSDSRMSYFIGAGVGLVVSAITGAGASSNGTIPVSYTHLRAHETVLDLVCRLLLEKKKKKIQT
eukprot:TRINITY_DN1056_c0_g1_i1.p1 TRINITY_DN1056_c0_g1~~TRINITY_DN1056_c0_g1_i1.p1  ORF type:complete len:198 (+),score=29.35 TRINITY_DN1056_c0_g1_i1:183-776(+)